MIDRIQKAGEGDYWKVNATTETKEDKKRDDQRGRGQGQRDSFDETSDFVQLLSKDPRKYRRQNIDSNQVNHFTFRGVSTQKDKAILEVDITLTNGSLIQGAQLAVSREDGMKFLGRKPGDDIVIDQLIKGPLLTVALPEKTSGSVDARSKAATVPATINEVPRLAWYYYLVFGVLIFAVLFLIYIFLML